MAADRTAPQVRPGSRPHRGRVVVLLAGVLAAGVLALAGWQTGWPPVIFGAKQVPAAARLASPPAARPVSSSAPQAPASIASASPPTASPGSLAASKGPVTPRVGGPAATVQAFFAAIDGHHYARAWKLGGKYTAPSYGAFVNGLNTTARDTVTVLSVSGNVATARLTAFQTDGTVKTFRGTYTIDNGVITRFHVRQIS